MEILGLMNLKEIFLAKESGMIWTRLDQGEKICQFIIAVILVKM